MDDNYLIGSRFMLYGSKEGAMQKMCGSQNFNLTTAAEVKKATKPPNTFWASNYYGELSYTLTATGICNLSDSFTHRDIMNLQINRQPMFWVGKDLDNHDEFYAGHVIVNSVSLDKNYDNVQMYSISCTGDGGLITTNPYEIHLFQTGINDPKSVLGVMDQGKLALVIKYVTGGLPPIKD
ncbi:Phage tail tube protein [Arachidicoccus rhizosphaerae]|uniref:Phage tail tube protein n=1 Tax=Arachidicoccus rhizosphaerae TaxID=551991 RepID=A0A1H3W4U7_9BACT|nr:phage tail tube protein [Arachidicoccus rhizosphaerae]SDZ82086.1 Phage tail tube protein [Arachidicoccus rhizosphaerae]